MAYNLLNILKNDKKCSYEYEDERLISNIYLCSLSTSLRELDIISKKLNAGFDITNAVNLEVKETDSEDIKDLKEKIIDNQWLLNHNQSIKKIKAINFDKMPETCNVDNSKSVDSLIIDFKKNKCFLIEFKKCSKNRLIDKYFNGEDSILDKLKNSKNILKNLDINSFNEEKIVSNTEIIIVYEKNDSVEPINSGIPEKRLCSKDENGKQNRACNKRDKSTHACNCNLSPSKSIRQQSNGATGKKRRACSYDFINNSNRKVIKDKIESFKKKVLDFGYSKKNLYFEKEHGIALCGADDFSKIIDNGFFEQIEWGECEMFFDEIDALN